MERLTSYRLPFAEPENDDSRRGLLVCATLTLYGGNTARAELFSGVPLGLAGRPAVRPLRMQLLERRTMTYVL